ncbi:ArsR/SmtB family transcription factor [Rossellomorea aquimaris]|uniref:ArsR/SmtB family transcription factor n=1 Tax=Rossellomorea aquimaris TaxID=189382 RepID=UPI0007D0463E|nr:metalloregulator ArsR/SmtB family transcription factor [Rossellomorea aquimaris]
MDILHTSSRKRETYSVHIKAGLLWECALGIAAVTNSKLLSTLEKPLKPIKNSLSKELTHELNYVGKHNTWKTLLMLLHQKELNDLSEFSTYLKELDEQQLRYHGLPFTSYKHGETRLLASKGDSSSIEQLKKLTSENPFYPKYIEYICFTPIEPLKKHLEEVMYRWYQEVIEPEAEDLKAILERDRKSKIDMREKLNPEELVEWATGGITYLPEPSVLNVLLIPQSIYRPWNVEGDIEGTKIFYYPIANESISPEDKDTPNYFLVHKHKALGDEVRLRIMKLLSRSDLTLQDITNVLELGKSTIHHHLKILRSARLVEVHQGKYILKENGVTSLSKELHQYLFGE